MKIKLIVATSENNIIGLKNDLPWNLPDDMNFFKKTTLNSCVIMGKKNYLSIPDKFRPLKKRINIVLTTDKSFRAKDCLIAYTLEAGIELGKSYQKDIFIIGGGMVYDYAIKNNLVDVIYLTRIHANVKGDVMFPDLNMNKWKIINEIFHPKDKNHKYAFTFFTLIKN